MTEDRKSDASERLEERIGWFADRLDATQCELIGILLRTAFVMAWTAHGMSCGARVQTAVKAGVNIGHALGCALELRDTETRNRAKHLIAQVGATVTVMLECAGKPDQNGQLHSHA